MRGAAFSSRLDLEIPKSRFSIWLDVEIPIEDILIQGFRKLVGAVILLPLTTWKGRFSHNSKNTKKSIKTDVLVLPITLLSKNSFSLS